MTLAFYRVSNSKDYERHTFDNLTNYPSKIIKMLEELDDDEYRIYDMSRSDYHSRTLTAADFVEDYNDEILDGGWWCINF